MKEKKKQRKLKKPEIIKLLLAGHTTKAISLRIPCDERYARKVKSELKNVGMAGGRALRNSLTQGGVIKSEILINEKGAKSQTEFKRIRLHGECVKVTTWGKFPHKVWKSESYTVKRFKRCLMVWKKTDEIGFNEKEAVHKSRLAWNEFFSFLDSEWKVRVRTLDQVRWEFATTDSDLSKKSHRDNKTIRVFDRDDGRLRLTADRSKGDFEHETHHYRKAQKDSKQINLNLDWLTDSDLKETLRSLAKFNELTTLNLNSTVKGLNAILDILKGHEHKREPEPEKKDKKPPQYIG